LSAYADTSFLVSLYVADSNSAVAASEMAGLPFPMMLNSLGELELDNAIQLRVFALEMRRARVQYSAPTWRREC